ncbi:tetratricopeptide repeat protein [Nocardia sp. NPDC060256]|uniref:tetratricopeptide repeat protein n=1 Tax=unclassified Nocardia TaxID=2637762 RepID=UPI0036624A99
MIFRHPAGTVRDSAVFGHYRQALTIKQRILGGDHPEIAVLTNNLATLLHQQQRHTEATEYQRRALHIATRTLPPEHPILAAIRHNLARSETDNPNQQTPIRPA